MLAETVHAVSLIAPHLADNYSAVVSPHLATLAACPTPDASGVDLCTATSNAVTETGSQITTGLQNNLLIPFALLGGGLVIGIVWRLSKKGAKAVGK